MFIKVWWSILWRNVLLMPFSMLIGAGIGYLGEVENIDKVTLFTVIAVLGFVFSIFPFYFGLKQYEIYDIKTRK